MKTRIQDNSLNVLLREDRNTAVSLQTGSAPSSPEMCWIQLYQVPSLGWSGLIMCCMVSGYSIWMVCRAQRGIITGLVLSLHQGVFRYPTPGRTLSKGRGYLSVTLVRELTAPRSFGPYILNNNNRI